MSHISAKTLMITFAVLTGTMGAQAAEVPAAGAADPLLRAAVDGPARTDKNKARDVYRHPFETLSFFGLRPNATVVEIGPSTGWWAEILAPYLREKGTYYAAESGKPSEEQQEHLSELHSKVTAHPEVYDKIKFTKFWGDKYDVAPANSADFVLTFRNVHNWVNEGNGLETFKAFYRALKPGGVLGVEEHRGRTDQPQDPFAKDGYVRQDYVIALAEKAGFKFVAASEVNANPKDSKDYSGGVWTLPPTYRLKDENRETYRAIGESDRATLLFVKAAPAHQVAHHKAPVKDAPAKKD